MVKSYKGLIHADSSWESFVFSSGPSEEVTRLDILNVIYFFSYILIVS